MMHPARRRRTHELARLDPAVDWHQIYRRLVLWELPKEARLGFQLAFYRSFAIPRMAAVLAETGHFRRDATRRAYDTGLVMHEVIYGGVDSDRGRGMIRLMNRLHDRPDIHPDDMTYLLNALVVVPTDLMDATGWRTVTAAERAATVRFYVELGRRMGIVTLPASYPDAEAMFHEHEATHLEPSPAGSALTTAVLGALRDRMPHPVRHFTPQITSALLDDARLASALGLPPAKPSLVSLISAGSAVHKRIERLRPPAEEPSFWPGMAAGRVYPQGYNLDQLGPQESQP